MRLESVTMINSDDLWVNYGPFCEVMYGINKACTATYMEKEDNTGL